MDDPVNGQSAPAPTVCPTITVVFNEGGKPNIRWTGNVDATCFAVAAKWLEALAEMHMQQQLAAAVQRQAPLVVPAGLMRG